jgi:hypothetical protein
MRHSSTEGLVTCNLLVNVGLNGILESMESVEIPGLDTF